MFLVFHALATPASLPLLQPDRLAQSSLLFTALVFSREGRGEAGMPTHSSAV